MSEVPTKNFISPRCSAQIICEYLNYAINSVLFGRVLFPPGSFKVNIQYGITLYTSEDPRIKGFLNSILTQTEEWLVNKEVFKLSLIIRKEENNEVLECWDFNIQYELGEAALYRMKNKTVGRKNLKTIPDEIRNFMWQVDAMMSYLPLKFYNCTFNVLIHVKKDIQLPEKWIEVENVNVATPKTVLYNNAISTSLHRMQTNVFVHK